MNKVQEHTKEFSVAITMDAGIVTLDNTEIRQLYFIEDIFSFALVGKMIIQENRGIFEFGPLTGNETITLVYGEDEERVRQFKIYKINKIDQVGNTTENVEAIEIFFADNIFFVMNFLQFSRSWKDTIISTIIKELGDNYLEIIKWDKFEETNEKLEYFYMPYWNIKTAIHWLIKRSTGKKSGEPGFCFYSNSKGVNFITLESLLKEKRLLKLSGNDDGIYSFHEANDFYFNKILSWSVSGIDMASLPILAGGVKKGFNSLEKKFINKEFEYKNSISKMTLLGGASLFPDISQKNVAYQLLGENNEDMIDTMYHNNWNKKYVLQQAVSLVLRGHEDRTCGSMIEIFWPSGDIDDHYNKHMHGKYLIKSVTHVFSGYKTPAYQQKLICIKNGYGESDVPDLVKASKRNN